MINADISFWFVLASAVIHMLLGLAWYSSILFGAEWSRLAGITGDAKAAKKGMGMMFAWSAASALVMCYALAVVFQSFAPQSLYEAVSVAVLAWIGLSAATNIGQYIFLKKSLKLFLINNAYNLVSFVLIAVLFRIWN